MPRRLTGGCGLINLTLKCLLTYAEESILKCLLIADDSHEISSLVFLRKVLQNMSSVVFMISALMVNPYKPCILFVGHRQTVQTKIRCHQMPLLIKVSNVCLQNVLLKFEKNENYHLTITTFKMDWR